MTAAVSETARSPVPAEPPRPEPVEGTRLGHGPALHVLLGVLLFAPAAVLVVDGNLAVDDALVRFALALLAAGAALALLRAVTGGADSAAADAGDSAGEPQQEHEQAPSGPDAIAADTGTDGPLT